MARLRLPDAPMVLTVGRSPFTKWDRTFETIMAILGAEKCARPNQLPMNGVLVIGSRPSAKQLEAARARCDELIELTFEEFVEVEITPQLLNALLAGEHAEHMRTLPRRQYSFRDQDLRDLKLPLPRRVDVSGSDLSGCAIEGGIMVAHNANFTGATLEKLTLTAKGATFTNARLNEVKINTTDCTFTNATLQSVSGDFRGGAWAGTSGVGLQGSFKKIDLSEWVRGDGLPPRSEFKECHLRDAEASQTLTGKFVGCTFESFRGVLNPEELRECKFIDSNLTGSVLMGLDLASCTFTGTNTDGTFRFANTPYAPCDDISELTQPRGDDIGARFRIDGGTDVDVLVYIYSLLAKVKFGEETGTARLPIPALAAALRATNAKLVHLQAERPEVATFWAKVTGKQIELRPSVTVEPDEKMHAMLRDHYDDDNVWSVFADWLVESGDPRGRALRRHLDGSGERCEADVPTIRDMRFRSRRFFVTEVTVESPSVRKPVFMSLVEHPAFALLRSVNYSAFSPQAKHLVQKLPVRKVRCRRPYHSRATFFGTRFVKSIKRAEHLEVLNADGVQVPKKMLRERLPNLKVLRASIAAISDIEVDTLVCESSYPYKNVKARRVGIEKNAPSITSVESYSTSVKHIIESTRGLEEIILVGYLKTPGEVTDDVRKLAKSRGITLTDSVEAIAAFRELL